MSLTTNHQEGGCAPSKGRRTLAYHCEAFGSSKKCWRTSRPSTTMNVASPVGADLPKRERTLTRTDSKLRLIHSPAIADFHCVQYLIVRNRDSKIGDCGGIA